MSRIRRLAFLVAGALFLASAMGLTFLGHASWPQVLSIFMSSLGGMLYLGIALAPWGDE